MAMTETIQTAATGVGGARRPSFGWPARFSRIWQFRCILGLIFVVGILFRVAGTRFGFPLLLHPDEPAIVNPVIDMARRNSFEPRTNLRPDHVEMKVDYLLFAGYSTLFKHVSIERAFSQNPVPFYWIARLATAAFGVATVALAYLVGALTSRRLGLILAALFAVFPAFVRHSHYATPDVPVTFALMLLTYALMRYLRSTSRRSLLWASFAVALGVAIKYPAAVGTVVIGIVIVAAAIRDRAWRRLIVHALTSVAAVLGFLFVISSELFTNFSDVRHELHVQAAGNRLGHPDLGLSGNMHFYVSTYVGYAGIVLASLALVGLVLTIRSRELDRLPWVIGILVWGSLSTLPLTWERWGVPMWVTPLMLAGVALAYLSDRFRTRRTIWIPLVVSAVVGINLVAGSLAVDTGLVMPDTRAAALTYVKSHGITSSESIYEGYTPFLPGTPLLFFRHVTKGADGYVFHTDDGQVARYAVLSSSMYDRVFADHSESANQQIYRWIFAHGQLLAQFSPIASPSVSDLEPVAVLDNLRFVENGIAGGRSGPVIKIYRLPQVGR
jgi:hypothetical protein